MTVPEATRPAVEWILWKHFCGRKAKSDAEWKKETSEVAHFFVQPNHGPFSHCDLDHLPVPSKSFFLKNSKGHHDTAPAKHTEYSLFKKGIEPLWEDEHCQGEFYTKHYFPPELLDQYWRALVQGVMEAKIDEDHICGVRVVDKSHKNHPLYKLEIWLNTNQPKYRELVRQQAMKCLEMDDHHRFKLHWREFDLDSSSDHNNEDKDNNKESTTSSKDGKASEKKNNKHHNKKNKNQHKKEETIKNDGDHNTSTLSSEAPAFEPSAEQ